MMLTQHLNSSNNNGKHIDIGKAMLKRSFNNYLAGKLLILSQIINQQPSEPCNSFMRNNMATEGRWTF